MSPRWLLLPLLLLQVAVAIPLTAAATSGCELLLQHHLAPTRCWCKHSCRLLLLLLLLRFSIVSIVVGVEKHQYVCVFISAVHRRSTSQTQMTPPAATRCCCSSLMLPAAVAAPDGYCVALLLHLLQLPAAATAPCCCPMLLPLPDVVAAPSCCHYSLSLFPLSFAAAAAAAPYCCCAMLLLLPLLQPPAAAAAPELPPASCCWCSSLRLLRGANAAELWLLLLLLLLLLPLPPARCCGWQSCCFISNDRLLVSKTPVCLFAAFGQHPPRTRRWVRERMLHATMASDTDPAPRPLLPLRLLFPLPLARCCGCPSWCFISSSVGVKNTSLSFRRFRAASSSDALVDGRADAPRPSRPRKRTQRQDCDGNHHALVLTQPLGLTPLPGVS